MSIAEFSIRRPITTIMCFVSLVVVGSGTRSIPPITSARSMAPAIGTEVPFTAANSGAPTVSFGNPPGWTKST